MNLHHWLRQLAQRWSLPGGNRRRRSERASAGTRRRVRPRLEMLEERLTPAIDVLSFSVNGGAIIAPNQPSGAMSVQLLDTSGKPVTASSDLTIKLSSTSSTAQFLDLSGKALTNSSINIPTGSSFALFEYEDSQTGSATIKGQASNGSAFGGTSVSVQNELAFTSGSQLVATGKASGPIAIQLQDASGNPVKATTNTTINLSTFSSTAVFLDTSGNPLPKSPTSGLNSYSLVIPAGSSSASFELMDTQQGTDTISATTNFGADTTQQEFIGAAAAITSPPQVIAPGKPSGPITLQLATAVTGDTTVTLSSSSSGGQFLDTSGNPLPKDTFGNYTLTIPKGDSSVKFEYEDSQTGTAFISANNFSLNLSASQSVQVGSSGTPLIVSPAQTLAPGQPSQLITVQLQNQGKVVTAASAVTVDLASSSSGGTFLDASGNPLKTNSITIAAGSSTATFEYEDSLEGFASLTASPQGSSFPGTPQVENVGGLSIDFGTGAQTISTGSQSGAITVQLMDSRGNVVSPSSDVIVSLSSNSSTGKFLDTSGSPLSPPIVTIAKGKSSASFEYEDTVGGKPTLTANVTAVTTPTVSTTQQETVNGPYTVSITSTPQALSLNQSSQPITVQLMDSTGAPATATSAVTVSLSSSSSGGTFLDTSGNPLKSNSITIAAGTKSASFEYEDSQTGLATLTASENGFSNQQTESAGLSFVFTTAAKNISAGQTSSLLTVQLQDGKGNPFNVPNKLTVNLNTPTGAIQFLDSSGKPLSSSFNFASLTLPQNSSSVSFEFTSTYGGTPTISATLSEPSSASTTAITNLALSASQKETIQGIAALTFMGSPVTVTAGQTSGKITLQLEDNNGKPINAPSGGLDIALFSFGAGSSGSFGATATTFFDANGNPLPPDTENSEPGGLLVMPAGSNTVSFEFQSTAAGSNTIFAQVLSGVDQTAFGQTQVETVQAASPSVVAFVTSSQSMTANVASGTIFAQLQDKFGNPIAAGSGGLKFNLSSSSSTGQFLSVSGDSLASPSFTIPQGARTAAFEYLDTQAGTPTLTVTANGISGTQQVTISPASTEIHVTNTNDSGAGSLRAAITAADNSPGSTIVFDSGATGKIDLLTALPIISSDMNIIGPGANNLTIEPSASATGAFGGFVIEAPVTQFSFFFQPPQPIVTISGLTVANFAGTGIANLGSFEGAGGGNNGSLTLRQVNVSNNQAPQQSTGSSSLPFSTFLFGPAGGIYNINNLTVIDSTVANNTTTNNLVAAGIDSEAGNTIVINSTIAGNNDINSNSAGGIGIYGGTAMIANSTISGNTATQAKQSSSLGTPIGSGGGIDSDGSVTIFDSIVAGNKGSPNNPTDVNGPFISLGNNLIGSANSMSSGFVGSDQVGTAASPIDAKLGPLANNGGPTPTMTLQTGSPAIGKGSSANAPATDQRGDARPLTGAIDIGAVEVTAGSTSTPPSITGSPSSQSVVQGQTATFTASASGNPTPTVQWQVSTDGGKNFTNLSGQTSTTLTLTNVTLSMNGNEYQAVFTNSLGNATTSAATLTVSATATPPSITTSPSSVSVSAGLTASFTASATGTPTPTVQWQVSTDGGKNFTNISGATSTTLTLNNVTLDMSGDEYQAVFNNSAGSATTKAATLTVTAVAPSITGNPSSESVTASLTATFTASASGAPTPTVQWQISTDGGKTFTDIHGATSTTLTIDNVTLSLGGDEYRAVFTNSAGSATTSAATLTVKPQVSPIVTGNPSGVTVTAGQTATFVASATGAPTPTVQWQVSTDGGKTFTNIQGATSTTLTLSNVTTSMNGNVYHAVFTNSAGTATSAAATLTVNAAPPPPTPKPPTINPPPLLAFLNSLFGGVETVNPDGSATITDSIFGIPLFVSLFNAQGQHVSVTIFGIDITFLFSLL